MTAMKLRIQYYDTTLLEFGLATMSVVWGLRVLSGHAVMASSSFEWLNEIASDHVFGAISLVIGLSKLVTLKFGRWALWTTAPAAGWWAFVAYGLYEGNPSGPGWATYGGLAFLNLIVAGFSVVRDA